MSAPASAPAASGYRVLARGTKVSFLRGGALLEGKVVAAVLDPNRKPGIGRVSYDVEVHPAYASVRVKAVDVQTSAPPPSAPAGLAVTQRRRP